MQKTVRGTIRGKTIELAEVLGLADGQEVEITVRTLPTQPDRQPGEGLLRTEGALADDQHWDGIMEQIHRERKLDTRRETSL
jgi:hypothetical protein